MSTSSVAGQLAEKVAAEAAEQIERLEEKCRTARSELSAAVTEQQALNSKVRACCYDFTGALSVIALVVLCLWLH